MILTKRNGRPPAASLVKALTNLPPDRMERPQQHRPAPSAPTEPQAAGNRAPEWSKGLPSVAGCPSIQEMRLAWGLVAALDGTGAR